MEALTPIAIIESRAATQRALQGAHAGDPVRADAPARRFPFRRTRRTGARRQGGTPLPAAAEAR